MIAVDRHRPIGPLTPAPAAPVRRRCGSRRRAGQRRLGGRQILDQVSFTVGAGRVHRADRLERGRQDHPAAGRSSGCSAPGAGRVLASAAAPGSAQPVDRLRAAEGAARPGHADAGPGPGRPGARRAPLRHARPVARAAGRGRRDARAVDAERFADARVGTLSGGEQQRVLIAHALIARPPAAPARRAAGQPRPALAARRSSPCCDRICRRAADRGAAVRPRDEPAAAGDGPGRLPRRRAGRGRAPPSEVIRSEVLSRLYGHHVDVLHVHGRVIVVAGDRRPRRRYRHARTCAADATIDVELTGMHWVFEPGFFSSQPVHVALVIGGVVAVVSAVVGVFTVLRGQSFAGHALTDVSTAGGSAAFLRRGQPAARVRRRRRRSGPASMDPSASNGSGAGTWPPASCSAPSTGLAALFLYLDTTTAATTGATQTDPVRVDLHHRPVDHPHRRRLRRAAARRSSPSSTGRCCWRSVSADIAAARGVPVRAGRDWVHAGPGGRRRPVLAGHRRRSCPPPC